MQKKKMRQRETTFMSNKCGDIITVIGESAHKFAKTLEADTRVYSYKTSVPVKITLTDFQTIGIRPSYLKEEWLSDFQIEMADGRVVIVEVTTKELLTKKAEIEKLELSRRFWLTKGFAWMMAIV